MRPSEEPHLNHSTDSVCVSPFTSLEKVQKEMKAPGRAKWLFCSAGANSQVAVWEARIYFTRLPSALGPRSHVWVFRSMITQTFMIQKPVNLSDKGTHLLS